MKKIFFAAPLAAALCFLFPSFAFSEVTVINPAPGSYANLQSLVIEANGGEEVYYSFSGSDPMAQGFAYDGPVLLDVTGNVELRVAAVGKDQKKSEIKVAFSVEPAQTQNEEHAAFLKSFESGPCFDYEAGSKISVPFSMSYSFFQNPKFEKGREISISKKATMERYVPINLTDGSNVWRYALHVLPASIGALSRAEVPFRVEGWTKLVFTDPKSIYSLDGSWWQPAGKILSLDRGGQNKIYYQSADYSPENPVSKIILPPKPQLSVRRQSDGSVKVRVADSSKDSDKYALAASPLAKARIISSGLYKELLVDAFPGDKIEDELPVDVYYDGVLQGTLFADIYVNRLTPNVPVIKSSASSSYSRDDVWVSASCGPKLKIYFSVSNPVEIEPSFEGLDLASLKYAQGEYNLYGGQKITLFGDTEKILAYKVSFYSEDEAGVQSASADYSVVIDKYNYYVDPAASGEAADGSPFAPYKDLSLLSKIVRSKQFARFFIKGSVALPPGEITVNNNVEFCGVEDARVHLPANSVIVMKNAGLYAQNVVFEKESAASSSKKLRGAAKALTNFFMLDNSAATFKNCEIIARFSGDGKAFNCSSSSLRLESTGVAANAEGYACAVNASGSSKVNVVSSRVLSVADTAVAFSSSGGTWTLDNNFAQVTGRMGRPAEFVDALVSMTNNKFTSEIHGKADGFQSVYAAGKTQFLADEGNVYK